MNILNNDGYNGNACLNCPTCRHTLLFSRIEKTRFNWISTRHLTCTEPIVKFSGIGVEERETLSTQITANTTAVQKQLESLMGTLKNQQSLLRFRIPGFQSPWTGNQELRNLGLDTSCKGIRGHQIVG